MASLAAHRRACGFARSVPPRPPAPSWQSEACRKSTGAEATKGWNGLFRFPCSPPDGLRELHLFNSTQFIAQLQLFLKWCNVSKIGCDSDRVYEVSFVELQELQL